MRRFIGMLVAVIVLFGILSPAPAGQIPSHVYVAARNQEAIPDPLWGVIGAHMDAYMMGAQGPDIAGTAGVFQSKITWGKLDYGIEAHYEKTGLLALYLLTRAKTQRQFAFAVGWVSHFINDSHVHPVINSYGGYFAAGKEAEARHKALEMLETKHVFADPGLSATVAPYDFNRIPDFVDTEIQQLIYEVYKEVFGGKYDESTVRRDFGYYLKISGDHARNASRNFLEAHRNREGKFTLDPSGWLDAGWHISGTAAPNETSKIAGFDRLPSEAEYKLIMEGPLTVMAVRVEKEKVVVSLKVNDSKLLGRFVKDWEKEIELASTSYKSGFEDINIFYRETLGAGRPYNPAQNAGPVVMGALQRLRGNLLKDISLDDTPHPRFGTQHPWPGEIKGIEKIWFQSSAKLTTESGAREDKKDSSVPLQIRNSKEGFLKSLSGEAEIEIPVANPDNDSYDFKARLFALDPHTVGRPPLYQKYDYVDITANYVTDKKKDDKKDDKTEVKPPAPPVAVPMKLSYCLPGNWEGGLDKDGVLVLNRKAAKMKGPCGWDSSVTGKLTAKYHPGFSKDDPKTAAEARDRAEKTFKARRQGDTPNDMAVGLFMGGGIEGVSSIIMGDFDGSLADFAIWIRRGSGGMFGYTGSYMGANGRGHTVKTGTGYVEFGYNAWGGGCWDNSDRAYLVTQCAAAQREAKAILECIRVTPDSKVTATPYEGPKYDGSDLPKVTLAPSKKGKIRIGESITVKAVVENGKPEDSPYTYNWGGTFDGKPEDVKKVDSVTLRPTKPGKFDVSASVDGARFGLGSDTYAYEVADLKAKVERVPAENRPVPVGMKTGFKVTLTSDGQPVTGNFIFRWQPHPEIPFSRLDEAEPDVTATFPKPGRVKVWVQVLEKRDGALATLTESEQVELEVIKPTLSVSVSPPDAFVGQEVRARVAARPELKEIDYRWMPLPANAKLLSESQDKREITFYAKDDQPIEVKAQATLSGSGDDLGEAKGSFRAKKYGVSVTGPRLTGPKPKIWKEGVGLVEVDNAIAADQEVEFAAHLNPAQESARYVWSVTSGACKVLHPLTRTTQVVANEPGSCQVAVIVKDKNDVTLGSSGATLTASISRETIAAGQKRAKDVADAKAKVADAKGKVRKGDYDGAIKDAEDATKLDPANKEAADTARQLRQEKETIHQQIDKAKKLMDENRFADAQKELIVASNLNSYYPPVPAANSELGDRWRKYNDEVRDKVYEVRSANEKKDFGKALEIAAAWRASTKLDPYAERELKQQEDWAKQWKAQKDRQIGILKEAGEKVKSYDYAGALKQYDEGFANGQNIYNGAEPEYKEAVELRGQAFTKNKRLSELIPWVRKAAEDKEYMTVDALQNTLKTADEAIALQPNNEQLKKWREQIVARAEKTKADNERVAVGRKHLDAARSEENIYLSQLSSVQSQSGQWGENIEVDMQSHIQKAIDNYRESLKYIPDAAVEKKIKELEATLEGRKKYLENYRLSVTLRNEADALYRQATQDPDIQSASPKYDEAAEKYRKSLSLYRPFNAENVEKTIYVLEYYKHERWVKKYWADGQALEKENKIVEAIAIYDKAIASFHPTVPQNDRMYIIVHQQDLKNRVNGAKNWRADGEAKQKAGKIAEAIVSYRQSLKLLPDAALEEHVRMLEGKQAEAGEKKATADKLWQEGTALFNQGRPSDALTKFKESLGYYSDATRTKYVADMEARRAKAVALREEGAKLQQGNRIPEAIAKYKESLSYWPDTGLSSHIATLEGKLKQDNDTAARKARAKQLRDEGYALQQKNQLQAAVGKYKESLAILPDKQLEDYIRQLEAKIAAVPPVVAPTPPATPPAETGFYLVDMTPYGGKKGAPRKVKNIEVDDGSWIRLKATHEKKLRLDIPLPQRVAASAVAVVSNLDNAHNVPDKMTTTVLTVQTTSGERVFEIKAGVHSSEWNRGETSGATHAWPKETNIGGPRWMAVFSLPAGSVVTGLRFDHRDTDKKYYHGDAAPGFCLRGITLVGSAVGDTAAAGQESAPGVAGGKTLFNNGNTSGVYNNPSRATTFTLREPHVITLITNYHWNNGRGATPGTITLRGSDGRTYGSWRTSGSPGQGGVPNAYWNVAPNVTLPAGTYTVIDSDPATWAQNGGSQGCGHTRVEGYPVSGATASAPVTAGTSSATATSISAELTNSSRENTHIFTENETFGPGNRLAPGEKLRVAVTMKSDGSVTFKAGRNGQVMATKTWRGIPGDSSRVPVVVFDESNPFDKLTVTTGLR